MVRDVLDPELYASGDPSWNGLPHELYEHLRDNAPVHRQAFDDPLFVDEAWVLTRYDDVVHVLRSPDRFTSVAGTTVRRYDPTLVELGGKPAMISMDGAPHRVNRQTVLRSFTPTVVRGFDAHFRSLAVTIVDAALERVEVDFVADIAAALPLHAICDVIGVPEEDRPRIMQWTNTLTVPTDPDFAPSEAEFFAAINGIWSYGSELAERKRRDPGSDVMSVIAKAAGDHLLTDDEVMGFMLTLAAAGNETTRNAASHSLLALLQRPDAMARLRGQANDIGPEAIEELLRWSSPVLHSRRTATQDVELHGQRIAAGDAVVVVYPAANFDPRQFPNPFELDLARTPNAHVAFAMGPHFCLGAHVARLELKVLFEELLRRTSEISLAGDPEYVRDNALRGVKRLPVRLVADSTSVERRSRST